MTVSGTVKCLTPSLDLTGRLRRISGMRVALLACVAVLLAVPAADAKDLRPGDLRLCDLARCVPIRDRRALDAIGRFYYGSPQPSRAAKARKDERMYQLRFRNGYVTGFVAGRRLDRFLSGGVNLGQFAAGVWYRMPAVAAAEIRRLAHGLPPLHVTPSLVSESH